MYVLAKLARLAGVDELHTGTVVGKMEGGSEEVQKIDDFLKEDWRYFDNLRSDWSN
jgi:ribulose-bisphosphate carboxylase large chain